MHRGDHRLGTTLKRVKNTIQSPLVSNAISTALVFEKLGNLRTRCERFIARAAQNQVAAQNALAQAQYKANAQQQDYNQRVYH